MCWARIAFIENECEMSYKKDGGRRVETQDITSRSKSIRQLTLIDNSSTGRAGLVELVSVAFVLFCFYLPDSDS